MKAFLPFVTYNRLLCIISTFNYIQIFMYLVENSD